MSQLTVAKFGGTSLANARQTRKVIDIIRADPARKVIVVSAPGKRGRDDTKVTDLLLSYDAYVRGGSPYTGQIGETVDRYREIAEGCGATMTQDAYRELYRLSGDTLASRGEYVMAKILAQALGFAFCDASLLIYFKEDGSVDWKSTNYYCARLTRYHPRGIVVPGFYGSLPDMTVKTFSRGGSDITGAILAAALNADLYENWTDVSGTLMADPRTVETPAPIPSMTYQEMLELAYAGANVLHDEAVFPARKAGIPINIRNTNAPTEPGTLIVADEKAAPACKGRITGIAARKGFTSIRIEKTGMSSDVGYVWSVLGILKDLGVSWEHMPSRIESVSLIVADEALNGKLALLKRRIETECAPDRLSIRTGIALICIVGRGMAGVPGMLARFSTALADASINIRMMDQDDGEISIMAAVDDTQCERAVRASYAALATH